MCNIWAGIVKRPSLSVIFSDAGKECCYTILFINSHHWRISHSSHLSVTWVLSSEPHVHLLTDYIPCFFWSMINWLYEIGKGLEKEGEKHWGHGMHRHTAWRVFWIFSRYHGGCSGYSLTLKIKVYAILYSCYFIENWNNGVSFQKHATRIHHGIWYLKVFGIRPRPM